MHEALPQPETPSHFAEITSEINAMAKADQEMRIKWLADRSGDDSLDTLEENIAGMYKAYGPSKQG